jgi:GT2 family glycosyltransferase
VVPVTAPSAAQRAPAPLVVEVATTTEWPGEADQHWVIGILVVHNGQQWLPRTLDALRSLERAPNRIVAVDAGSEDNSAELLRSAGDVIDQVVSLETGATFGQAVHAAVREAPDPPAPTGSAPAPTPWLWLLHDDSAPEPAALAALLAEADRSASAGVLGPKVRGWHDPALLVECGLSITNSGRRYTGFDAGDRDQGQRDDLSDVLAVGSPGMLVRGELWERLGGFDPALPTYGDDIEFCMRARRADARVLVVPAAVVHHREAGLHGQRRSSDAGPRAVRAAGLYTTLVHGPAFLLPFTSALLFVRTLVASLLLLPAGGPRRAWAEMRVWLNVHLHPGRVVHARDRLRSVAEVPRRELRSLRPGLAEQWGLALEHSVLERRAAEPGGQAVRPIAAGTALVVGLVLAVVAAVATSAVWSARGVLQGGALLPAADGTTLWSGFRSSWHDVGLGSGEAAAPYVLALIGLAAPPGVSIEAVAGLLLLATVPLAGVTAFLSLRGLRQRGSRAGLAIAYALTPAAIVPSLDGRLGTAVVAVLLPWLARLLVRLFASTDRLPQPSLRTAAGAALLLAVCAAFAPLVWGAVAVLVVGAAILRTRSVAGWVRVAIVVLAPVAVLWPWSAAVFADPGRAMFEAGVTTPDLVAQAPPGWRLLLLDPGTLGSTIGWAALPLLALAAAGIVWQRSRPVAVWGWWIVLIGLVGATFGTTQRFVPLGAADAQFAFAGPMLLVMAVGMVLAAASVLLAAGPAVRRRGRTASVAVLIGLLLGPGAAALLWVTDLAGPLQRSDEAVVPAFVTEEALSSDRIRTVVLQQADDGSVGYTLVNGAGARLGDADVAPPAETWREVSEAVGQLVAGIGPLPVQTLAENAVRYLVADVADEALAAALDGNSALRRLSTSEGRGLWEVEGVTSRARLGEGPQATAVPIQPAAQRGTSELLAPERAEPVELHVAQVNDGLWTAVIGDSVLPVSGDLELTVPLPGGPSAAVVLEHDQRSRDRTLLVPLVALVGLFLLLPRWRRFDELPDPDLAAAPAGAEPGRLDLTDPVEGAAE